MTLGQIAGCCDDKPRACAARYRCSSAASFAASAVGETSE